MVSKCVHKGCGKTFESEEEECVYHPEPPIFHEGQKGVRAPTSDPMASVNIFPETDYRK